ncbi:MAG: ABC transporter permease [Actinomycetota bacterium]
MSTALALRVVEGNARAYRRTWKGTVVTAFVNPLLFLLAMGQGVGSLVEQGVGAVSYIDFIAPGLLAASAMQTAATESTWPIMAGIKWQKTYHAALATPIGVPDLVSGNLAWIAARTAMTCVAFAVVAGVLGAARFGGMLLALPAAVLTGMAFAAPLVAFTAIAKNESRLSSIFRFAIIPMFLFSGTFFPIDQLPGWMQPIAYVTPLWHGVDLCRALALDLVPRLPALVHIAYLTAWIVLGWFLARRTLRKALVI